MPSLRSAWRELDDSRHFAVFYRLWALGTAAGFTLRRAMDSIGPSESGTVETLRQALLSGAASGHDVGRILRSAAPRVPPFDAALLTLGNESGHMEQVLGLLADFHERRQRLMLGVRKRLAYPMFTGLAAAVIAPLPVLVSGRVRAYLMLLLGAWLATLAYGGRVVLAAAGHFARAPRLVQARLARALAIAIQAGLPLERAVPLAAAASGDPRIADFVGRFGARQLATQPLTATFAACPQLTPEFLAILGNAERTGDFAGTIVRLADLYDDGFK